MTFHIDLKWRFSKQTISMYSEWARHTAACTHSFAWLMFSNGWLPYTKHTYMPWSRDLFAAFYALADYAHINTRSHVCSEVEPYSSSQRNTHTLICGVALHTIVWIQHIRVTSCHPTAIYSRTFGKCCINPFSQPKMIIFNFFQRKCVKQMNLFEIHSYHLK